MGAICTSGNKLFPYIKYRLRVALNINNFTFSDSTEVSRYINLKHDLFHKLKNTSM